MDYHHLEPVIGLEIHVQLKTRTTLFSPVDNHAERAAPNTLNSAIDVGHPGTLPQLNAQALRFAVRIGLALGCRINSPTFFDFQNRRHKRRTMPNSHCYSNLFANGRNFSGNKMYLFQAHAISRQILIMPNN